MKTGCELGGLKRPEGATSATPPLNLPFISDVIVPVALAEKTGAAYAVSTVS